MKKITVTLMILLTIVCLFAQNDKSKSNHIKGSKDIVTREIKLKAFSSVNNNSICDLEIIQSSESKAIIKANSNLSDKMHLNVNNGTLTISMDKISVSDANVKVFVYTPKIDDIKISGTGDTKIKSLTSKGLSIHLSGTGDISTEGLNVDNLSLLSEGTGGVNITQNTDIKKDLVIENSGTGDVIINKLARCTDIVVNNTGTGDVRIIGTIETNIATVTLQNEGSGDIGVNISNKAERFQIKNSGTGDVKCSGYTNDLTIINSGSGDTECKRLETATAHITNTGTGDVYAYVKDKAYLSKTKNSIGQTKILGNGKRVVID